jgi:HD-like signal output (HDOD) protein
MSHGATHAAATPASADATLALLWERVHKQGDMPGFTRAVNGILGAMRGEEEKEFSMTETVLSDPVLTQKVLKLANSGMYSAFGQRISTVSRAVLVLGADAIGHLALGLKLIEELSPLDPSSAHVEMEKAVLAGIVAKQVAASAASADTEQAVVCSMLHTLGRMMVTYYMPEKWNALQDYGGAGYEDRSAGDVLGLAMEDIGRAVAEQWGLPHPLISSMRRVEPAAPGDDFDHDDWLAALSTMSSQCADSLWHDDPAGQVTVRALASSFSAMLGVEPERILAAIERARELAAHDLTIAPLARPAERQSGSQASTRMRAEGNKVMLSGVADMRDAVRSASPGQMMSMALETAYQGLSFSRAIAFMRNRREKQYFARLGFGDGVKQLLPALVFDDAYEANVFHAALGSDRVLFIENAQDPAFAAKLPAWWKASLSGARSFIILPLCTGGQAAGFIYGDWDESVAPVRLNQSEFGLLNDLRALVVKAVERRQLIESIGGGKGH